MGFFNDFINDARNRAAEQAVNQAVEARYTVLNEQVSAYKKDLEAQATDAINSNVSIARQAKQDANLAKTNYENMTVNLGLPQDKLTTKGDTKPMKKWMIYGAVGLALYYFYKKGKMKA